MCDRSRGRSGCTRRRTTARANGPFRVWISGASGCRLPRDVAASGIPNTIATRRFPGTASARSLVLGSPWQSCTERPHLPRGVAQPSLPHMIATKARAGQCPTPLPDRHARASTTTPRHLPTPGHPWSSCAGRSPVPRAVVWDPVQPRIATAAELSHCPRLSSWRGP